MIVEASLFGFGDERPQAFGNRNDLALKLPDAATIAVALQASGITDPQSLSVIVNGAMVPRSDWASSPLADGDTLKLLMAIEGG